MGTVETKCSQSKVKLKTVVKAKIEPNPITTVKTGLRNIITRPDIPCQ